MSEYTLYTTGLLCPLPVVRTQDRARTLAPDDVLVVHCTDPGALNDIPAWCRINGHQVLETVDGDNEVTITLKIGAVD